MWLGDRFPAGDERDWSGVTLPGVDHSDGPVQGTAAKSRGGDRAALEALVVDNRELDRLEALLANFNIFEALGVIRQEIRHSDFLAFLLDPKQNHGLGDTLLRRLLQRAVQASPSSALSVIDLDVWSLADAQVQREWQNIDIFIREPAHHLAVVVENKIDSGEHSDQLARYWDRVKLQYPDTTRLVGILLTHEGVEASLSAYSSVSYSTVCELVEDVIDSRGPSLAEDMRILLRHYTQMLRRHIVSDSEIADLCRRIYQRHQRALDLIFEHRPDQQAAIRDALAAMIQRTPGLLLDRTAKTMVNFLPVEWDSLSSGTASSDDSYRLPVAACQQARSHCSSASPSTRSGANPSITA